MAGAGPRADAGDRRVLVAVQHKDVHAPTTRHVLKRAPTVYARPQEMTAR
jgi:hypothetical protein